MDLWLLGVSALVLVVIGIYVLCRVITPESLRVGRKIARYEERVKYCRSAEKRQQYLAKLTRYYARQSVIFDMERKRLEEIEANTVSCEAAFPNKPGECSHPGYLVIRGNSFVKVYQCVGCGKEKEEVYATPI